MEKSASMSYALSNGGKATREKERDRRAKGRTIDNSRGWCRGWQRVWAFAFIGRRTGPRPRCQRYSKCNLHRWRLPAEITNALWLEQVFYRSLPEDRNEPSDRERERTDMKEKESFEIAQRYGKEGKKKNKITDREIERKKKVCLG